MPFPQTLRQRSAIPAHERADRASAQRLQWLTLCAGLGLALASALHLFLGHSTFDPAPRITWVVGDVFIAALPWVLPVLWRRPQPWVLTVVAFNATLMGIDLATQDFSPNAALLTLGCTLCFAAGARPGWQAGAWLSAALLSTAVVAPGVPDPGMPPLLLLTGQALGGLLVTGLIHLNTRQARAELARAEQRLELYRNLLENTQRNARVGGWAWQPETGRVEFTDSLRAMLGVPDHEVVRDTLPDTVMTPREARRLRVALRRLLRTGAAVDHTFAVRTRDGRELVIRNMAERLRTEDGVPELMGTVLDETERRRVEQTLLDARHAAERSVQARSRFLANMSHEMRTPLNGIIGMTSLLDAMALEGEQQACVDTIRASGQALLSVINEVLDFSRIESGRIEPEAIAFDLEDVAVEALAIAQPLADARGLDVTLEWNPDLRPDGHRGDPSRIRQILVNLLSNAVKFTRDGRVTLHVARSERQPPGVALSVVDTGIGIPRDLQGRLFDPFTQADASTTRRFGGTGLGLSISRGLAELMGGTLGVSSTPDSGSIFTLTLPIDPGLPPMAVPLRNGLLVCVGLARPVRRAVNLAVRPAGLLVTDADDLDDLESVLVRRRLHNGRPLPVAHLLLQGRIAAHLDAGAVEALRARLFGPRERARITVVKSAGTALRAPEAFDTVLHPPLRPSRLREAFAQGRPVARAAAVAATRAREPGPDRLAGLEVLVAEDNPVNQRVACAMLERLGVRSAVAGNGQLAMEALARDAFPVVLMDLQMPEMDGLEATRRIRRSRRPQPWIVAMTANIAPEDRDACLEAGMDDFLAKPATLQGIRSALERALEARPDLTGGGALRAGTGP